MTVKLLMLVIFFSIMIGVGFYSRRHATNVNDFVLGGMAPGIETYSNHNGKKDNQHQQFDCHD